MSAAAILKSTLPVEPTSREMNFLFVIFNQKCNFYWDILTFKVSLLLGALMLKRFCKKSAQTFTGQNLAVILTGDPLIVNLKAANPQKAHVSIGTRLMSY